jgi:hypothetical protein
VRQGVEVGGLLSVELPRGAGALHFRTFDRAPGGSGPLDCIARVLPSSDFLNRTIPDLALWVGFERISAKMPS